MSNNKMKKNQNFEKAILEKSNKDIALGDGKCLFRIKSYLKNFYSINDLNYSDSDDSEENDDKIFNKKGSYEIEKNKVIKSCNEFKQNTQDNMNKLMNLSLENWNLFEEKNKILNKNTKKEYTTQYDNKKTCSVYIWRCMFCFGVVNFLLGSSILFTSLFMDEHQIVIGEEEEIELIDRDAIKHNESIKQIRDFSVILISFGLFLFLSTMLLPTLIGISLNCFKRKTKEDKFLFDEVSDSEDDTCLNVYVKKNEE